MVGSHIVEFPSGRPLVRRPSCGPGNRSVAGIVQSLCGRRRFLGAEPDTPIPVRLRELAGIGDETVERLSILARDGIIAPASAARLAMRHSDECGGRTSRRRTALGGGATTFELTLAGDPFGQFALRLDGRSSWTVFAPMTSFGCLTELCTYEEIQACLLIGCSDTRRTTVRLLDAASWRRLLALGAITGRCGSRHLLLLGGHPFRRPGSSSVLAELERAIRRGGNTELVSTPSRKRLFPEGSTAVPEAVREPLILIELTYPGLVDVPAPDGRTQ